MRHSLCLPGWGFTLLAAYLELPVFLYYYYFPSCFCFSPGAPAIMHVPTAPDSLSMLTVVPGVPHPVLPFPRIRLHSSFSFHEALCLVSYSPLSSFSPDTYSLSPYPPSRFYIKCLSLSLNELLYVQIVSPLVSDSIMCTVHRSSVVSLTSYSHQLSISNSIMSSLLRRVSPFSNPSGLALSYVFLRGLDFGSETPSLPC